MSSTNLIDLWIDVGGAGNARAAARELSDCLGRNITTSRLYEWRNGRRLVPDQVQQIMRHACVDRALRDAGVILHDDAALDALAASLSPPPHK